MNVVARSASWRPRITPLHVAAGLVVAVALLPAVAEFAHASLTVVYLLLVVATIVIVRRVAVEPGSLLSRRPARRSLVLAIAVVTALITAGPDTAWLLLIIVLALLDASLGIATSRIASADAADLDEYQEGLRNRAHRVAYALLAAAAVGTAVVGQLASPATRRLLSDSLHGGALVALGELIFFLPAMVVAWIEPDRVPRDAAPRASRLGRVALAMVAASVLLPVVGAAGFLVAPAAVTATTAVEPTPMGSACRSFEADVTAGVGVSADVPLHAVVCWDGRTATEAWGLNASDCNLRSSSWTAAALVACDRTTAPDGSLHYRYTVELRPAGLPFLTRQLSVSLVVDRDGRVVQFP